MFCGYFKAVVLLRYADVMKMITIWYFYIALKKQTEKFDHVESSEPSNSLILKLQKPLRVP